MHVRRFADTMHKLEITHSLIPHQDRKQLLVHNGIKTSTKKIKNQTRCNSQLCFALGSKYLVLSTCKNAHFEYFIFLMADKKAIRNI